MLIVIHSDFLFELSEQLSVVHHPSHFGLQVFSDIINHIPSLLILKLFIEVLFRVSLLILPYFLKFVVIFQSPLVLGLFLLNLK